MWINQWAHKTTNVRKILVVAGLILMIGIILALKEKPASAPTLATSNLADAQLDRALANHKPVLAFYHSNTCDSCIQMIDIVQQVYPAFSGSVALVDVNVYDPQNQTLLEREKIQYIPTLILYQPSGQNQTFVGVMEPEQLRQKLVEISKGQ